LTTAWLKPSFSKKFLLHNKKDLMHKKILKTASRFYLLFKIYEKHGQKQMRLKHTASNYSKKLKFWPINWVKNS